MSHSEHQGEARHSDLPPQRGPQPGGADREAPFAGDIEFLSAALPAYSVVSRIAVGGQGVVYRATNGDGHSEVAIKILLDGPLASARESQRLQEEARVLKHLEHPNIVALRDAGIVRGRPYLVFDYVQGMLIDDYCVMHDLAPRQIVELFLPVCDAVACAHRAGIVHRDLKPANILIDKAGRPRLLDFGLARVLNADDSARLTQAGAAVGTVPYLSPEQAGGQDGDCRSDIYGLGLVLYALLSDGPPFPPIGDAEAARRLILTREITPLRDILAAEKQMRLRAGHELTADLDAIVMKAIARRPSERYATPDALCDDLQRYLHAQPPGARREYRRLRVRRWRQRWGPAVLASACTAALTVTIMTFTQSIRQARSDAAAARVAAKVQAEANRQVTRDAIEDALERTHESLGDLGESRSTYEGFAKLPEFRSKLIDSIEDLHELAGPQPEDPGTRHALAELYLAVGDSCRVEGRWKEAAYFYRLLRNLSRARAGAPDGDRACVLYIRAAVRLSAVRQLGGTELAEILPEAAALLAARAEDDELRYDVATLWKREGYDRTVSRRRPKAIEAFENVLALAPPDFDDLPATDRWQRLAGEARALLAWTRACIGEDVDYIAAAVRDAEQAEEAARQWRFDVQLQTDAVSACTIAARYLRFTGEWAKSEQWGIRALERALYIEEFATSFVNTYKPWRIPANELFQLYMEELKDCQRAARMVQFVETMVKAAPESEPANTAVTSPEGTACRTRAVWELECGDPRAALEALACFAEVELNRPHTDYFMHLKAGNVYRLYARAHLLNTDVPEHLERAIEYAQRAAREFGDLSELFPDEEEPVVRLANAIATLAEAYTARGAEGDAAAAAAALLAATERLDAVEARGHPILIPTEFRSARHQISEIRNRLPQELGMSAISPVSSR